MQRYALILSVMSLACAGQLFAKPVPKLAPAPMVPSKRAVIETNHGRIVIELEFEKAPITVKNFLEYADEKFYEGTIFHRVISEFMIQGGGHTADMKEKPARAPIVNESTNGLSNLRGTIAAARTSVPNSATSQFFINTKDNTFLDRANSADKVGYCVFGRVVEGMNIIDEIRRVATKRVGVHADVPVQEVTILSVRRLPN